MERWPEDIELEDNGGINTFNTLILDIRHHPQYFNGIVLFRLLKSNSFINNHIDREGAVPYLFGRAMIIYKRIAPQICRVHTLIYISVGNSLLGPSTAQDVIQLTTGQTLNHQGMRDARLLVMDAATVSPPNSYSFLIHKNWDVNHFVLNYPSH